MSPPACEHAASARTRTRRRALHAPPPITHLIAFGQPLSTAQRLRVARAERDVAQPAGREPHAHLLAVVGTRPRRAARARALRCRGRAARPSPTCPGAAARRACASASRPRTRAAATARPSLRATGVSWLTVHAIGSAGYASSVHVPVMPTLTRPSSTSDSSEWTSMPALAVGHRDDRPPGLHGIAELVLAILPRVVRRSRSCRRAAP